MLNGMRNHSPQIFGRTAVIHPQQAVRLATTTAKIPSKHVPIPPNQRLGHPLDILSLRIRLKTVGKDGEARVPLFRPLKIKEIPVRKLQSLPAVSDRRNAPEQCRIDRLQVAAAEPRRRMVIGILY